MSFPRSSPSISSLGRSSKSTYLSSWANETVVPPPEHSDMRLAKKSIPDLASVVNHHSNDQAPGHTDFAQPDQTDNGDSTNMGGLTMKELGLPEVVTAPETITIYEACSLMSAGAADAVVLTDSNALPSGILTNKDIVSRVIAAGIDFGNTPASKVMTKNPIFVSSDAHPIEAMRKMVQGEVTKVPIIENGKVIGIVRLAKCIFELLKCSSSVTKNEERELVLPAIRKLTRWKWNWGPYTDSL